ncbi:MAG: hypothetical protein SGCHY_000935 [Lobulomycetales sp.]
MEIQCIAIIGPQNNLLFIKTFPASVAQPDAAAQQEADRDTRRKFHFLCHTACDVFDTAVASATVAAGSGYLGLLYSLEDLAIFGYRTNTRAKLLIVTLVSDRIIKDADVVSKFKQIHTAYVRHIANPFTKPNSLDYITSKKLDASITQIAKATIEGDA